MGKLITIDTDDIESIERLLKELKRKREIAEMEELEMAYDTLPRRVGINCGNYEEIPSLHKGCHSMYNPNTSCGGTRCYSVMTHRRYSNIRSYSCGGTIGSSCYGTRC